MGFPFLSPTIQWCHILNSGGNSLSPLLYLWPWHTTWPHRALLALLHFNLCRYWWNCLGFSLILAFLLFKPSICCCCQNEAPHTAIKTFSAETTQIYFSHLNGFFQAFYSWHLERRWIQRGQTLTFSLSLSQGIGKRENWGVYNFFFSLKSRLKQSCSSFLFILLWCSFYSNLAIIAPEKPLLAQWWADSCYRGCNYSLQTVWEFGFSFIKRFRKFHEKIFHLKISTVQQQPLPAGFVSTQQVGIAPGSG